MLCAPVENHIKEEWNTDDAGQADLRGYVFFAKDKNPCDLPKQIVRSIRDLLGKSIRVLLRSTEETRSETLIAGAARTAP